MKTKTKIMSVIAAAALSFALAVFAFILPAANAVAAADAEETKAATVDRTFSYGEELRGKSVVFYGDSITARYINNKHFEQNTGAHYIPLLAEKFGFYYANRAVSGAVWGGTDKTVAMQIDGSEDLLAAADCVSIFLGTNDYGHSVSALGSLASPASDASVCGYIKNTLDRILSINPDVKIMLLTPVDRYDGNRGMNKVNSQGFTLADVCDAVKTLGEKYGCTVADVRDLITESNRAEYLQRDDLHLSSAGYAALAARLENL